MGDKPCVRDDSLAWLLEMTKAWREEANSRSPHEDNGDLDKCANLVEDWVRKQRSSEAAQ